MDKISKVRIEQADGSYSDEISIATSAEFVTIPDENTDLAAKLKQLNTLNNQLSSRITLAEVQPKSEDGELTDIRVGYDGTRYNSAGEAVRKQFENVVMWEEDGSTEPTFTTENIMIGGENPFLEDKTLEEVLDKHVVYWKEKTDAELEPISGKNIALKNENKLFEATTVEDGMNEIVINLNDMFRKILN